jgi:hypothetical protein
MPSFIISKILFMIRKKLFISEKPTESNGSAQNPMSLPVI